MNKTSKADLLPTWHQHYEHFYDYIYQNPLDYPCTSCQWGPIVTSNQEYSIQKIYYGCRTGNQFSESQNFWKGAPNYIAIATVEIPNSDHYFIPELRSVFGNGDGKMHNNIKVRTIIHHPGQITILRSFPLNRKIFTTKNDCNQVFIWTNDKYKPLNSGYSHNPDITLLTTRSAEPNFALVFTPTFPRVATSSGNKIEVFDLESATSRRELGSVSSNSVIAPSTTLDVSSSGIKEKIQDIAFKDKNNQICVAGGQGKRLGIWDLRLGKSSEYVQGLFDGDIHSISWKQNFILAGSSDGKVVILDDRMTKSPVYSKKTENQILSVHWSPSGKFFAIGSDNLYFYKVSQTLQQKQLNPMFTHFGMRGPINDFDWGSQNQWNIIATCHQAQSGGSLHILRPIDLLYLSKDKAVQKLQKALEKMSPQHQDLYL